MRNFVLLGLVAFPAVALGGCIGSQEMLARHEATCAAYGFVPGSQGFANCLLQMEMSDHGYSHHGRRGYVQPAALPAPAPQPR